MHKRDGNHGKTAISVYMYNLNYFLSLLGDEDRMEEQKTILGAPYMINWKECFLLANLLAKPSVAAKKVMR